MAFNVQGFIQNARSKGVPDKEIYNYLQSKNLLNAPPQQTPIAGALKQWKDIPQPSTSVAGNFLPALGNAILDKTGLRSITNLPGAIAGAVKEGAIPSPGDFVHGAKETLQGLGSATLGVVANPAVGAVEQATGQNIGHLKTPFGTFQSPETMVNDYKAQGYSPGMAVAGALADQAQSAGQFVATGAALAKAPETIKNTYNSAKDVVNKVGSTVSDVSTELSKVKNDFVNPAPQTKSTKAINSLEKTYNEIFTGTKAASKQFNKSVDMGKSPARFLAENGIVLDVNSKGKISTKSAIDKIEANAAPIESMLGKLLEAKDKQMPEANRISLDQLGQLAKERITTPQNKAGGYLSKQYADIDRMVGEWKQYYGDSINLTELNQIKSGQWQQSRVFDATRPSYTKDVHYNVAKVAQKMVEDAVPEAEIKNLNSYLGDHYETIKNLSKIEGNAVKGGMLTRQLSKVTGAVVGSGLGPIGSIAGAYGAEYIQGIIQSNSIAGPLKVRALREIPKSSPVFDMAQKAIMQIETGKKLLPAPTNTSTSPKSIKVHINRGVIQQQGKKYPGGLDRPFKGQGALSQPTNQ